MTHTSKATKLLIVFALFLFISCDKKEQESNNTLEIAQLKNSYIQLLEGQHSEFLSKNDFFNAKLNQFFNGMINVQYTNAREAWKEAYKHYNYLGPFIHASSNINPYKDFHQTLGLFVTNPSYIEVTTANQTDGIIPNVSAYPVINQQTIENAHLIGSSNNISLGFHALELILWGEDTNPNGPGIRVPFDYENSGTTVKARRKQYLIGLNTFHFYNANEINISNFKQKFYALENDESMQIMLSGIYHFAKDDCAEKTIKKPYDTQDASYEESPYSDNTINDIKNRIEALKRVLYGDYFIESNGLFLMDYFKKVDEGTYTSIDTEIKNLESVSSTLSGYFDNSITNTVERQKLLTIYTSFITISNAIEAFATKEGITQL